MKQLRAAFLLTSLLGAMILLTSCNPTTVTYTEQCIEDVALQVGATLADGEALTFGNLVDAAKVCVSAVTATFNTPSNSPSSPEVDLQSNSSDGTFSSSVQSNTWGNCTDYNQTVQFNFSVPFAVVVGSSGSQVSFNTSPQTASNDNDLVAQKLFVDNSNEIASTTTSGPSQSDSYEIGPHTQVTFTLPIEVNYKYGDAQVVHTDGSTVGMPWFFIDGYQQAGQITYATSSC